MKTWHKILAVVLSVAILGTSTFIYFRIRNKEKEVGRKQEIKVENLADAILDSSELIIPEHRAELPSVDPVAADPLQKALDGLLWMDTIFSEP